MIFPYLPSAPPETQESILREFIRRPAAYRIHGPFYPSVVLTEPSEDGSLIMLQQIFAIRRMLSGDYRPVSAQIERPSSRLPLDVAPCCRIVPDDCICSCQSSFQFHNDRWSLRVHFKKKWTTAVGLAGLFDDPRRLAAPTGSLQSSTAETQQIAAAC